jgi:MFS family permease
MTTFFVVWIGQLFSLIGSELTGFTLGVWVYQQNNSATQFALISLCTLLPSILLSPIAGIIIDRWDRRLVMLISDIGAGLTTLSIALLFATNQLSLVHIYALTAIASIFNGFQNPAFIAASSLFLSKDELSKGSGLISMSEAISRLVAPALGGVLLSLIELQGVMVLDFMTFFFAVGTLLIVRFPAVPLDTATNHNADSFWLEATTAWRFLKQHPGLLALLSFFCVKNVFQGIILVLITPLALSFSTPKVLGMVLSMGGVGMIVGSGLLTLTNDQQRRTHLILTFTILMGLSIFSAGFRVSVPLFTLATFLYSLGLPLIHGSGQIIFQLKTPPQIQGRVFSFNNAVAGLAIPLGYLLGGPLSDYVFEPLMAPDGLFANTLGIIIGVGPGRGIGLMFIVLGCLHCLLVFAVSRYLPFIEVETLLPDQIEKKVSQEVVQA